MAVVVVVVVVVAVVVVVMVNSCSLFVSVVSFTCVSVVPLFVSVVSLFVYPFTRFIIHEFRRNSFLDFLILDFQPSLISQFM